MNMGAPGLSEIITFMECRDFVPVHLTEIHVVINILVQIDIAFIRRDIFKVIYGHDDIAHRDINPSL
jgi:hypothetical protein